MARFSQSPSFSLHPTRFCPSTTKMPTFPSTCLPPPRPRPTSPRTICACSCCRPCCRRLTAARTPRRYGRPFTVSHGCRTHHLTPEPGNRRASFVQPPAGFARACAGNLELFPAIAPLRRLGGGPPRSPGGRADSGPTARFCELDETRTLLRRYANSGCHANSPAL